MHRFFILILAILMLGGGTATLPQQQPTPQQQTESKELIVYVTRTGKKDHRANCRYLSRSKISISLEHAKAQGYTPCSVCNPPR
jgi:micrococcal nuclease